MVDVEFVDDALVETFVQALADVGFCAGDVAFEEGGCRVHVVENAQGETGDYVGAVDDGCDEAAGGETEEGDITAGGP